MPVTVPESQGTGLYEDVNYVTYAMGKECDRVEQPRADDVAILNAVVTVSEAKCRSFNISLVARQLRVELLRENRMCDDDVLDLVPGVSEEDSGHDQGGSAV